MFPARKATGDMARVDVQLHVVPAVDDEPAHGFGLTGVSKLVVKRLQEKRGLEVIPAEDVTDQRNTKRLVSVLTHHPQAWWNRFKQRIAPGSPHAALDIKGDKDTRFHILNIIFLDRIYKIFRI
jgi:hypothetical protein